MNPISLLNSTPPRNPASYLETASSSRLRKSACKTWSEQTLESTPFESRVSVLERVQLAGGQFGSAIWKDVRLVGCDLANIRAASHPTRESRACRLPAYRPLLHRSRLARRADSERRRALRAISRRKVSDLRIRKGCNWEEADLQEADLSGSIFRSCNLTRADLDRAKLQKHGFSQVRSRRHAGWDKLLAGRDR